MAQNIDDFKKFLNLMASTMPKGTTPGSGMSEDHHRTMQNFSHYLGKLQEMYKTPQQSSKPLTPPWMQAFSSHPFLPQHNWLHLPQAQVKTPMQTMEGVYQNAFEMWSEIMRMNLEHYERAQFQPLQIVDHDRFYKIELALEQPSGLSIRIVGDELRLRQISSDPNKEVKHQWAVPIPDDVERELIQAQRKSNTLIIKLPKGQKIQETIQDIIVEQEI